MKKTTIFVLMAMLVTLSSCELIGDIFKAGVWAGVLMVVGVIALVFFLISRLFGGGK
ncbi:MAG TPA: phosphatidate cytidylyltransferase [Flavipsychrobacter sp.]|nr:phosphatidate cytidylyltransferase [Flavipsychrobacter sp.]